MKNKILLLGFVAALLLIPAIAYSADVNPKYDVPTGVIISNGPDCTINYRNDALTAQTPVTANTVTTTVTSEYGFEALQDYITASIEPSATRTQTYTITNDGNASDKYDITVLIGFGGGTDGTGWQVSLESAGTVLQALTKDTLIFTVESSSVGEDGTYPFDIVVHPASDAPDKSWVLVTVNATTDSKPAGVYLGANGNTYGGIYQSTDATYTIISAAVMKMTKTASVDAPSAYTGGAHDAVPGSVITYTIIITNEGAGTARNVIVVDKTPFGTGANASTESAHIGMASGNETLPNVTLSNLPAASAIAWLVGYTNEASPGAARLTYEATDWTSLEGTSYPYYLVGSSAAYVRWQKASMPGGTTNVFTWGVIIK